MTSAIDELVTYLRDHAELNNFASQQLLEAISSQFKEVKAVKTGVNLEVEDIDEESIRASIMMDSVKAMKRTDSKMFGTSTHVLMLTSDFEQLTAYWEHMMEEQKSCAEICEKTAHKFEQQSNVVRDYYDQATEGFTEQIKELKQLSTSATKVQSQVDQIQQRIEELE